MLKNVLIFAFIALMMASCGNATQDQSQATEQETEAVAEVVQVAVIDFPAEAESLVGKEVFIEGTVIHVCKHGGKKMFIAGDEDPDVRIKITTDGEMVAAFQPELEGSYVKVKGIVDAVEAEVAEEGDHEGEEGVEHEEDADHENIYHKPQYSISCIEYAVVEEAPAEEPIEE